MRCMFEAQTWKPLESSSKSGTGVTWRFVLPAEHSYSHFTGWLPCGHWTLVFFSDFSKETRNLDIRKKSKH
jgi:hypothetical protein